MGIDGNMTIMVTDVVEHAFCPKFTYYTSVLDLKQYQEKRGTVKAGTRVHEKHEKSNRHYTPHSFTGKKLIGRRYYSKRLNLSGKIDEAVENDDEIVLIERKYTDYAKLTNTLRAQLGLLSILIEENTGKPVNRAQVIFSKRVRIIKDYQIDKSMKRYALNMLQETKNTIFQGIMPSSEYDNRCINCCFRKICSTGSLNTNK